MRRGVLGSGTRLPTHRDLAWRLKVTIGTVSRAYAEAERRGLVAGEVGRGTYIRGGSTPPQRAAAEEPRSALIDLNINRPRIPSERKHLSEALGVLAAGDLGDVIDYQPHAGHATDREAGSQWMARAGLAAPADEIIVTASGQNAMTCVFAAIARAGDTVAVEELTYTGMRSVASLLHLRLLPMAMDGHGVLPDALEALCRRGTIRAAYVMPSLHNPVTVTLGLERRRALAEIAMRYGVMLVEDDTYGFLLDTPLPPLASLAPANGFHLASTSKSLFPGLRICYVRAPADHVERVASAVRATIYTAPPLMARIVSRWIDDGTADTIIAEKRAEMRRRQTLARRILAACQYRSDPAASHLWLTLPEPWTAEEFAAAALRRGVAVSPAAAFSVTRHAPNAVRVAIGTPETAEELTRGLAVLAELLAAAPENYLSVV